MIDLLAGQSEAQQSLLLRMLADVLKEEHDDHESKSDCLKACCADAFS